VPVTTISSLSSPGIVVVIGKAAFWSLLSASFLSAEITPPLPRPLITLSEGFIGNKTKNRSINIVRSKKLPHEIRVILVDLLSPE